MLIRHLRLNLGAYFLVIVTLAAGVVVGTMKTPLTIETDIVNQLLNRLAEGQSGLTLVQCLINQMPWWLALGLLGLTVVGVLLVLPLVFFKGYCIGYTVCALARANSDTGMGLALAAVLPHNLIYVPCMMVMAVAAIRLSGALFSPGRDGSIIMKNLLSYLMVMIAAGAVMVGGALIESEITPWFISWW